MATGKHGNSALKAPSLSPGLGFAAFFIVAATLVPGMLTPLFRPAQDFTIAVTTALGELLGLIMTSSGDILTVNGFAMRIIGQCTALHYITILALAILLYSRHSVLYRICGVAVASGLIVIANAIRLIVTGLAGTVSLEAFTFVHEYLWVGIFALLVFAIWKVWADRQFTLTRVALHQAALTVVSCAAVFSLLIQFKEFHCRFLATLAAPLFNLLLHDHQATMVWDGILTYRQNEATIQFSLFFEIANLAVYAGLMLPYLWRNRKAIPLASLGLAVLVVMYAEFTAIVGVIGIKQGLAAAQAFQSIGSGVFLALPMALYWMVVHIPKPQTLEDKMVW